MFVFPYLYMYNPKDLHLYKPLDVNEGTAIIEILLGCLKYRKLVSKMLSIAGKAWS